MNVVATIAITLALPALVAAAHAQTEQSIYSFAGGNDGGFPRAGLIASRDGTVLYGTTSSDGTGHNGVVYSLTAPAAGQTAWTQTTLYAFTGGNDGGVPQASLLLGKGGTLYGTTYAGGRSGQGVVFRLVPPHGSVTGWTEQVLHSFTGGNDGAEPWGRLIQDASGNLYGTTTGGGTGVVGTVYQLTPPATGHGPWVQTVLYNFTGNADGGEPFGNVVFGPDRALYGTSAGYGANNYGTLYRLLRPVVGTTAWRFQLLHAFSGASDGSTPRDGMILDGKGGLYGTTAGFDNSQGTVFHLTQAADGSFTEQPIYNFTGQGFTGNGPWASVAMDTTGTLYGTTLGVGASSSGEVFRLSPPATGTRWTLDVLHAFAPGAGGQFPYAQPLIIGSSLFGTTEGTASQAGFYPGTVWSITP